MQICVQDLFIVNFSSNTCHDTVSYHDTTITYLFINYCTTSLFFQYGMSDTTPSIFIYPVSCV
jgi:hypothetical protein